MAIQFPGIGAHVQGALPAAQPDAQQNNALVPQNQANPNDQFVQQAQQANPNQANPNGENQPQPVPQALPDNDLHHPPLQAQLNAVLQNVLNNLNAPIVQPPQAPQLQPLNHNNLHHANNLHHPLPLHHQAAQAPQQHIAAQDENDDLAMQQGQADEVPGAWAADPMDVDPEDDFAEDPQVPQDPEVDNALGGQIP